jgi:hypothetical protein
MDYNRVNTLPTDFKALENDPELQSKLSDDGNPSLTLF